MAPSRFSMAVVQRETSTNTLQGRLELAKDAFASRAVRIQRPCVIVGLGGMVVTQILVMLFPNMIGGTSYLFAMVALLALLPSQRVAVRRVTAVGSLNSALLSAYDVYSNISDLLDPAAGSSPGSQEDSLPPWAGRVTAGAGLFRSLLILALSCYAAWCLLSGQHAFLMLENVWRCLGLGCLGSGLCQSFLLAVALVAGEDRFLTRRLVEACALPLYGAVAYAAWRPEFRAACRACLAQSRGREDAAAGLAALIGGLRMSEVLERGKTGFRCVPLDCVLEHDMARSTPDPALRELSLPAALGEVDAFLTHSWHDNVQEKWEALQQWREEFREEHGREPKVWIDKYCIDQLRIEESLACLPVFLAGCRKLVVLPGPTYTSRLWCVIELFTFITVGGRVEDIEIVPLQNFDMDWTTFDVRGATCVDPQDTRRLLFVLEGFTGTKRRFNSKVHNLFCRHNSLSPRMLSQRSSSVQRSSSAEVRVGAEVGKLLSMGGGGEFELSSSDGSSAPSLTSPIMLSEQFPAEVQTGVASPHSLSKKADAEVQGDAETGEGCEAVSPREGCEFELSSSTSSSPPSSAYRL